MISVKEARADGRTVDQTRTVKIHMNHQMAGEGSVLIEQGLTRVLCTASVEHAQPPHLKGTAGGWVTAEYSMLPRANCHRRAMRESVTGRRKGRTFEIERMIGRALRAVTNLKSVGPRTLYVDCDVLQADGGTRTASIIGGFMAMALAFQKGLEKGEFKTMPLRAYLAAVSVGIVRGRRLVDLTFDEDSKASVDMNVVWTSEGRLAEVDAGGEEYTFDEPELSELLSLSKTAAMSLFDVERSLLPLRFPI